MQNDSYNRGGFIAFIFSFGFSIAFFGYIVFFYSGIDLKEVPEMKGEATQVLADAAPALPKDVDVSKVENPWLSSDDMIARGANVYANNCVVCHGVKGLGDGVAGASLNPRPRNLVEGKWKAGGDSIALFNTLLNGLQGGAMASFKQLPVNDRWALVHYIRSITKDKPADDAAKLEAFGKTAK